MTPEDPHSLATLDAKIEAIDGELAAMEDRGNISPSQNATARWQLLCGVRLLRARRNAWANS